MTLVCKRWRRIYGPFLCRRIDLGYNGWENCKRVWQLLKNLDDRPDIRWYVQTIDLQAHNPNQSTCKNLARVVAHCKATRRIKLHTGLKNRSWPLLNAMKDLPHLESLRLSGHSSGPSIRMIFELFDLPSLKSLELSRYGVGKDADPGTPWPSDIAVTRHDLDQLLPPSRYHTSSVASLVLSNPSTPLLVSEHLLHWPARLEQLSITHLTHSKYAAQYNLNNIERLLGMHRQSLRYIKIGITPDKNHGMPNFSSFPYLEELYLSTYQILLDTPSSALRKLAAPSLRHLTMTFNAEDEHPESYKAFAKALVRWMADFASLKRSDYPNSRLKTIFIGFQPGDNPLWFTNFEDVTWPWDYLDQAVQILAQHGLALTYSEPRWEKQEWEELVETWKEFQRDAGTCPSDN